jgi:hypothetical protein
MCSLWALPEILFFTLLGTPWEPNHQKYEWPTGTDRLNDDELPV